VMVSKRSLPVALVALGVLAGGVAAMSLAEDRPSHLVTVVPSEASPAAQPVTPESEHTTPDSAEPDGPMTSEQFIAAWSAGSWSYANPDRDAALSTTEVAVVGTVVDVADPVWNTPDGSTPTDNYGNYVNMRRVTLEVTLVPWIKSRQDGVVAPEPGSSVDIWVIGDGTASGPEVGGLPPVRFVNEIAGPYEVGTSKLLFLTYDGISGPEEGRAIVGWIPTLNFLSNYDVEDGGRATNSIRRDESIALSDVGPLLDVATATHGPR